MYNYKDNDNNENSKRNKQSLYCVLGNMLNIELEL